MTKLTKSDWKIPVLLLTLSMAPLLGGISRLTDMSANTITHDNARFIVSPVPIIMHVVAATLYSLLGAFQFSKGFRLRWPGVHRRAGKVLAVCGLIAALTGVWMSLAYAIPIPMQGPILRVVRVILGLAMAASIVTAWASIMRRKVPRHEAFMIRAYAIGQGAGTQALILGPWMVITGNSTGLTRDLLMALSWAINIGVAELIIWTRKRRLSPKASRRATNLSAGYAHVESTGARGAVAS